jgi:hypothetical protein
MLPFQKFPLFTPRFTWRVDATRDSQARARAVHVLAAAGRRLRDAPMMIHRLFGTVLEGHAASISADPGARAEILAREKELSTLASTATEAMERLGVWPLVSMLRELDPETDVAFMQRLVE